MGNTESSSIATFNGQGGLEGFVKFEPYNQNGYKSLVTIFLRGFASNQMHAIHVHEYGDVSGGCMSAGGHYNPHNTKHGSYLMQGERHAGDMINNIQPYKNKKGVYRVALQYFDSELSPQEVVGRTVMIHELRDDLGSKGVVNYEIAPDGRLLGSLKDTIDITPYTNCPAGNVATLAMERGYDVLTNGRIDSAKAVAELKKQSKITGNAGGRMACAVIGIANPKVDPSFYFPESEAIKTQTPLETNNARANIEKGYKC